MSARKIASQDLIPSVSVRASTTQLELSSAAVRVRKNGIEFRSQNAIPVWTEMTVAMQVPQVEMEENHGKLIKVAKKVTFNGVVVACDGNRHAGYAVSMLFTNVPKTSQAHLTALAQAR